MNDKYRKLLISFCLLALPMLGQAQHRFVSLAEADRTTEPPQPGICHTYDQPLKMPCVADIIFA
ncbi:hypothetical protein G5B88_14735 [Herbaspirillum seropedicae]|uniref:hypothetical protein n=1 Tax=Herbaspirillum seropedicae TaxID=964 RepID=UPI00059C323B|nr:hypothetical protein [Herbaspirillum seropedicae]AKN66331.1 hypothetical protein ACP92_14595 [Herbaspirillum seropedicae]NQE30563.1 hypothetical protein [Herbaspirillum seropedicae]UMU22322.1 hypothetical protein G5B88_14735 [Herbaspirillum seropedicae]